MYRVSSGAGADHRARRGRNAASRRLLAYDVRMLFLVDGYNVTRRDPATADMSLQEQRDALVARLRVRGADLLGSGRIVIVFDGRGEIGFESPDSAPVQIVYARERSADDEIVGIASAARMRVTLVSDDRELSARVHSAATAGAEVRDASVLFEGARGARRARKRPSVARDAGLPRGASKITRELKDLWLKDDQR